MRSEFTRAKSQNSTSTAPRPSSVFIRRKATFSHSSRGGELGSVDLCLVRGTHALRNKLGVCVL